MRVDIVVFDGLDEMDALGPFEVLQNAGVAGCDVQVRLVTRETQKIVTGSHGLRFEPSGTYSPGSAILIVPGGGWLTRAEVGAWGEAERGDWFPVLRAARSEPQMRIVAGVCTGTMLLARAGLIGTRRASTHHGAWAELEATGATLVTDRVVDDGDLVTSGGVTSGIDLALWLVEREFGAAVANGIAAQMEYTRVRPEPDGPVADEARSPKQD